MAAAKINYWLMKTEPGDYTWDQLDEDGVASPQIGLGFSVVLDPVAAQILSEKSFKVIFFCLSPDNYR